MAFRMFSLVRSLILLCALPAAMMPQLCSAQAPVVQPDSSALRATAVARSPKHSLILKRLNEIPLHFEINAGQTASNVRFLSRGDGYTLFLTGHGAVLALRESTARPNKNDNSLVPFADQPSNVETVIVRLQLMGSKPHPRITQERKLITTSNYFLGNKSSNWHTHIPNYGRIRYQNVYPGIDLVYYGNEGQLENDFIVAPGADPGAITLGIRAEGKLSIDPKGDLVLELAHGNLRLLKPRIYQNINGRRCNVTGHYSLAAGNRVGFSIGRYDHRLPLIIDPVLSYSSYLGGSGADVGYGIAHDGNGNIYVTGVTDSTNFPVKSPLQSQVYGTHFIFVSKLSADGSSLIYSTYIGGSIDDQAYAIAVDSTGAAYITGQTKSSDFPVTSGVFQPVFAGGDTDAFITKLAPDGSSLVYSTFLGGAVATGSYTYVCSLDIGFGIAVDSTGSAYVTGETCSADFPTKNAIQDTSLNTNFMGPNNGFVTKISPDGSAIVYSTYLTGSSGTIGYGIAVDGSGDAYVTGGTAATDFPMLNGPQQILRGGEDAFVTAIKADGSAYIYSTYLGGNGTDEGRGIAVDSAGNAYVTGFTQSTNFPISAPLETTLSGSQSAFVTKVAPDGSAFLYSTYLGGSCQDVGYGIAVNAAGNAYVGGTTCSVDFPVKDPVQAHEAGNYDAFVSELSQDGLSLLYSTFLGGAGAEWGYAIATSPEGNTFLTGSTNYTDFPTANAFQSTYGGGTTDAFVSEVSETASTPVLSLSSYSLTFSATEGGADPADQSIDINNVGVGTLDWTASATQPWLVLDSSAGTAPSTLHISVDTKGLAARTYNDKITIASGGSAGSPATINVTLTVTANPVLSVDAQAIRFSGVAGGANPITQQFSIANKGSVGPLNWTASKTQPWLSLDATSGTAPATVHVSVDTSGLAAGSYSDTITITAAGASASPATIAVTLVVSAAGGGSTSYAYVTNGGSNTVSVIDEATSAVVATIPVGKDPVGVAVTPKGDFAYVANYNDNTVSVISTASASVVATIPVGANPWGVAITPNGAFAYVTDYGAGRVSVISTADNTVVTTILVGASPAGVVITPDGASAYVANYPANSMSVISTASNTVTTTISIGDPLYLAVAPDGSRVYATRNWVGFNASMSVIDTATNTIESTLPLQTYPNGIALSPDGAFAYIAEGGLLEVVETANNSILATVPLGTNESGVTVSPDGNYVYVANTGDNSISVISTADNSINATVQVGTSPAQVAFTSARPPTATLSVGTSSLTFTATAGGANPDPQAINITNTGDGSLTWTAAATQPWLSLDATSGTAPSTIHVSVNTSGLKAGTYSDTITITSDGATNSPATIPISLTVNAAQPVLSIGTPSLTFTGTAGSSSPAAQSVSIVNTGGGTLDWAASKTQSWLSLDATSGTAPSTIHVSVNTSGLKAGTYSDTITITSDGATNSPATIPISLTVNAAQPVLSIGTSSLAFTATAGGSNPAAQAISIANTGGGTLDWTASKTQPWLSLDAASGTAPSTIHASVDISGLKAGTYNDTITVTSDGATNSPATIPVTLTVAAPVTPPVLSVGTTSLTFDATAGGSNPDGQPISIANTGDGTLNWTASKTQSWLSLDTGSGTAPSTIHASVNISGLKAGTYNDTITVTSAGATNSPATIAVTLNVQETPPSPDFTIGSAPGASDSDTVTAGSSATYDLDVTPLNGFTGTVTNTCSDLPSKASCTFSPSTTSVNGSDPVPLTLTITTTAATTSAGITSYADGWPGQGALAAILLAAIFLMLMPLSKRRRWALATVLICAAAIAGCGGGSIGTKTTTTPGTPAGTYTVVVTSTSGNLTHKDNLTLTVK